MKKIFFSFLFLCLSIHANAGDKKTVTLVTSGQGKTLDEANKNALRYAIEQAFGAFISSHTEVVNDNLIKEEIISLSNGCIKKYEIIAEVELPNQAGYLVTLKSVVSINDLTNYCQKKQINIEVNGSLFYENVQMKEIMKLNEIKVLDNLILLTKKYIKDIYSYSLKIGEPYKKDLQYCLPVLISTFVTPNWEKYSNYLILTLKNLSMSENEISNYNKLNLDTHDLYIRQTKKSLKGDFVYKGFYSDCHKNIRFNLSQSKFDDFIFSPLDIIHSRCSYGVTAIKKDFNEKNYSASRLVFRNNISHYINEIVGLVENTFTYSININPNELNYVYKENYIKSFFLPILIDQNSIFNNNEIDHSTFHWSSDKVFYLQNFDSKSLVGVRYINYIFNPEDFKKIKNIEIN